MNRKYQRGISEWGVVLIVLILALMASLAGNAYFWHERDGLMKEAARLDQMKRDITAAATQCTASVDALAKDGRDRDQRIVAAMGKIAPKVIADQQASFKALTAKPDNPADLCGSLDRFRKKAIAEDRAKGATK